MNTEFTSLLEAAHHVLFDEGYMKTQSNDKIKQIYLSAIFTASDPELDYTGRKVALDFIDKAIARARREHGDKFAKDLENAVGIMHFPRTNHSWKNDWLQWRNSLKKRITAAGKLHKQDVESLKTAIKQVQRVQKNRMSPTP
jgi:hypothetical protein